MSSRPRWWSSHQSKNRFTARAYAIRVLRLRMVAVKNSMKRRLARSPWARMIAGSISMPARTSAGGGMIWSVKMIGCLAIGPHPSTPPLLYGIKDVMQYKQGKKPGQGPVALSELCGVELCPLCLFYQRNLADFGAALYSLRALRRAHSERSAQSF